MSDLAVLLMIELSGHHEAVYLDSEGDTYKPVYRALCLLLAKDGLAHGASREDAFEILAATHPFFERKLREERQVFEDTYDFVRGAFEP